MSCKDNGLVCVEAEMFKLLSFGSKYRENFMFNDTNTDSFLVALFCSFLILFINM